MDLLGAFKILKRTLNLFAGTPGAEETWATSEEAFERHFGESYADYATILGHLSPEQAKLFAATLEVNPEAAVIWILSMEEIE